MLWGSSPGMGGSEEEATTSVHMEFHLSVGRDCLQGQQAKAGENGGRHSWAPSTVLPAVMGGSHTLMGSRPAPSQQTPHFRKEFPFPPGLVGCHEPLPTCGPGTTKEREKRRDRILVHGPRRLCAWSIPWASSLYNLILSKVPQTSSLHYNQGSL